MQGAIAIFLAAGYETTATTLSYVSYHLALNPDIQQKLREEIDEYFPTKVCGVGSIVHIESYCPNSELRFVEWEILLILIILVKILN